MSILADLRNDADSGFCFQRAATVRLTLFQSIVLGHYFETVNEQSRRLPVPSQTLKKNEVNTMSDKMNLKPVAALVGATLVGTLSAVNVAQAAENPFGATQLESGYMQLAGKDSEGKCGEGKCGEGKCGGDKAADEGKCGGDKKDGEGKCGGEKAAGEGKCGEGKCGGDK